MARGAVDLGCCRGVCVNPDEDGDMATRHARLVRVHHEWLRTYASSPFMQQ